MIGRHGRWTGPTVEPTASTWRLTAGRLRPGPDGADTGPSGGSTSIQARLETAYHASPGDPVVSRYGPCDGEHVASHLVDRREWPFDAVRWTR